MNKILLVKVDDFLLLRQKLVVFFIFYGAIFQRIVDEPIKTLFGLIDAQSRRGERGQEGGPNVPQQKTSKIGL
jgi:hypothetical protein